jgi:hydroxyethylthiazole kinase-like uncharacterized protein yjeF
MDRCFETAETRHPLTTLEMTRREDRAVDMGLSRLTMMENAGSAVARFVVNTFETENVLVVTGTGNNAGDAFVAARHLVYWDKFKITLALVGSESDIHAEEALANWNILRKIPEVEKLEIDTPEKMALLKRAADASQVIIVAIFGTGFKGKPRELQASAINTINFSKATKISVDLPSGMEADSGNYEIAIMSDYTVTMDSPKVGMLASDKSKKACGKILAANIGVPK